MLPLNTSGNGDLYDSRCQQKRQQIEKSPEECSEELLPPPAFPTIIIFRLNTARRACQFHDPRQEEPSSGRAATSMPFSVWLGCQGPAVLSAFFIQFVDKEEAQLIFQTGNIN